MKFTTQQLAKIKEAYATGVLRVRYSDKEVTYQSLDEMGRAIERIERELRGKQGIRFIKMKAVRN